MRRDALHADIRLTHNTVVAAWPLVLMLDSRSENAPPEDQPKPCGIIARENVFMGSSGVLNFAESDRFLAENQKLEANEKIALLKRSVAWRDERNLYQTPRYIDFLSNIDHIRKWEEFWKLKHEGSLQGQIRFKQGGVITSTSPPEAFRLQAESLGQTSGKGGRDLGVNVNFVGPGDAWERWRKTTEYQKWLEADR
jgi:hypothetical protein